MNEFDWQLLEDRNVADHVMIRGVRVSKGDRVRLAPGGRGDVFDLALSGKMAIVEGIEEDYEGKVHLAVVVEEDPGRDIGMLRQPGHRFFFSVEEVEPAEGESGSQEAARKDVLIAGIGNIFLGDDAFGVEVARGLSARELPQGVRVTDFGIRGVDLAYALIDGYDVTILVDACPRGTDPGTLHVMEIDGNRPHETPPAMEAHAMNPLAVIGLARSMGGELKRILLVGCEPETLGPEEGVMALSEPVAAAVERAQELIESLIGKILRKERLGDGTNGTH